jgi:hypothetical protein
MAVLWSADHVSIVAFIDGHNPEPRGLFPLRMGQGEFGIDGSGRRLGEALAIPPLPLRWWVLSHIRPLKKAEFRDTNVERWNHPEGRVPERGFRC